MMKSYKKITAGMMAGFCVLSSQALVECGLYADGGGTNNMFVDATNNSAIGGGLTGNLIFGMNSTVLNKALLSLAIKCEGDINSAQINQVFKLSGVKKEDSSVPTVDDFSGSTTSINISGVSSFFTDSQLATLKILGAYKGAGIVDALKNIPVISADRDKWNAYVEPWSSMSAEEISTGDWGIKDEDIKQYQDYASYFINVATLCNSKQPSDNLKAWLTGQKNGENYVFNRRTIGRTIEGAKECLAQATNTSNTKSKRLFSALKAYTQSLAATSVGILDIFRNNNEFKTYLSENFTGKYSTAYHAAYHAAHNACETDADMTANEFLNTVITAASNALVSITDDTEKNKVATNIAVIAIIDAYYEGWYNNYSDFDYTEWSIRDCLSAGSFDGVDFDEKLTPYAAAAAAYAAAAYAAAAYAAAAADAEAYAAEAAAAAEAYAAEAAAGVAEVAAEAAAAAAAAAYALKAAEGNLSTVWPTIFGDKTEELTFNSSISNLSDEFTIDTDKKATLSYENNIITFNIPLDFPKSISIENEPVPIESFAVKTAKIHPMLSN